MDFKKRAKELVAQMSLAEKMNQITWTASAIDRLGVPAYNYWSECLHGLARCGTATVFPQAIAMAASFDDELLEEVADATALEARAKYNESRDMTGRSARYSKGPDNANIYRCLTMFTPNINIFRDPRWGRGHETYGEDPYLTGRMGSAFVRGLQGDGEFHKVEATIKHYAVHSGPEKLRHGFNADITDEELYGTYLKAFAYCIKHAHPASVMSAYNAVHHVPCTASKELLVDILRDKLGFDGYVVSDCGAVGDICTGHKAVSDMPDAAASALMNGCDLCLYDEYTNMPVAVQRGKVTEERITEACERIMESRLRLGMHDKTPFDDLRYEDVIECDKHCEINLRMAHESIVMLKNNGILPLKKSMKIAVVGPLADCRDVLLGNYNGFPSKYSTMLEGIQNAATGRVFYEKGCMAYYGDFDAPEEAFPQDAAIIASKADVIVMFMGLTPRLEGEEMNSGWDGCDKGDKKHLQIPEEQLELYDRMKKCGKPIVYVNISGSAIDLCDQNENCDAVLQCFYPGARGGEALADILFGDVCPSGKLPVTFYRSVDDLPPFEDYSMKGRTYRFFEGKPLYPFAHGLSYTKFSYSDGKKDGDTVTVRVKNTGDRDAMETVLLFGYDHGIELVGFKKITLAAGEEQTVTLKTEEVYEKLVASNGIPEYTADEMKCEIR